MRITLGQLKRIINERIFLEAEEPPFKPRNGTEHVGDSLDSQVDNFLAEYESEAKSAKNEGLDFRSISLRMIREATPEGDGDDPDGDEEDVTFDDMGDEGTGVESDAPKMTLDDVDIESFTSSVGRLIENFDSLLEVQSTIMRRARNFIEKSYDIDTVDAFDQAMRKQHGIVPGESDVEIEADEFPAPAADRSGTDSGAVGPA